MRASSGVRYGVPLRAQLSAAPLKPRYINLMYDYSHCSPRSIERGPIEALSSVLLLLRCAALSALN